MGKASRDKGLRIEREIIERFKAIGIHAERYPLSGASRFRGEGHDVDVYVFGPDAPPLVSEAKGRADGEGFKMLERWLGENDLLLLRKDRADPLVVMPWAMLARLIGELAWRQGSKSAPRGAICGAHAPEGGGNGTRTLRSGETA
jgi:hypothetical protein